MGHKVGAFLVGDCCASWATACRPMPRCARARQHPDRDAQFPYINDQANAHLAAGHPVISVDAKKKENVGDYANGGREWEPEGSRAPVSARLPRRGGGKSHPLRDLDIGANEGWVYVGDDHDTPAFAVATIARWWEGIGRLPTPKPPA